MMAQRVKHLPAMRETWVRSLGQEDPLEKEKATHSGTLVWKTPWTEKPGRLQSIGSQKIGHDWATSLSLSPVVIWGLNEVMAIRYNSAWKWLSVLALKWCPYPQVTFVISQPANPVPGSLGRESAVSRIESSIYLWRETAKPGRI